MLITVVKDLITYRSDLSWVGTKAPFFVVGGGGVLFCFVFLYVTFYGSGTLLHKGHPTG